MLSMSNDFNSAVLDSVLGFRFFDTRRWVTEGNWVRGLLARRGKSPRWLIARRVRRTNSLSGIFSKSGFGSSLEMESAMARSWERSWPIDGFSLSSSLSERPALLQF